jgi:hypothetical protein
LLHSDSTFRGFRQPLSDVTPGEADVFQFSIAKPTEDNDIRLARPVRDCGGNRMVYETTHMVEKKPELSLNF